MDSSILHRTICRFTWCCFLLCLHSAFAQNFSFTKLVDQNTPRPDGLGLFGNPHTPSTDGRYVVWVDLSADYAAWSADLTTGALTRLANMSTPVPGGTGNFTGIGQIGGGPYSGFAIEVRNGIAVFAATDPAGQGLYSVPASGGAVKRVVNYNTPLPNGSRIGTAGNFLYTYGLSDNGAVVGFAGQATGPPNSSVYSIGVDGSNVALIGDDLHRFRNPLQNPGGLNACVSLFGGGVAVSNDRVMFFGNNGGTFWGIYALPLAGPAQGLPADTCGSGPIGPLVTGSGTSLPSDPVPGKQVPDYDFIQTDGQNVYFHGSDWVVGCCSSLNGGWGGIFSVSITGGAVTKIVAPGDTLPVIGKVTTVITEFSVDAGGVVFIAGNESATPPLRGIFLYSGGQVTKVFASGDALNGGVLTQNAALEIWPQCYKNGKIAFGWAGGIFVAVPSTPSQPPSIRPGGVVSATGFGAFPSAAPGSWIEIFGTNFATHSRTWEGDDFRGVNAPTSLDGAGVTIGGQSAFVDFVGENQMNAQVPSGVSPGTQQVVVKNGAGSSPPFSIVVNRTQPGLLAPPAFAIGGKQYATALFPDGVTYVLPPGAIPSVNSRRAKPGDTIVFYGIGFGPVTPDIPAGQVVQQSNTLASAFQISIGGAPAVLSYSGLAPNYLGLYQFNVVVPNIAASDAAPVTFTLGGAAGAQTLYVAVQN